MSDGKRAKDLFVEGAVIVVSILLAFALEAGWEERGERLEETGILENLKVEFTNAGSQLDQYLFYHEVTLSSLDSIVNAVRAGLAGGGSTVEVPTIHLARAFVPPTFAPQTGTLDGLTHSGHFGIIRSEELRKALSAWLGLLEEAAEEDARAEYMVYERLDPVLSTMLDISEARTMVAVVLDEACPNVFYGRSCEASVVRRDSSWPDAQMTEPIPHLNGAIQGRYSIERERGYLRGVRGAGRGAALHGFGVPVLQQLAALRRPPRWAALRHGSADG